MKFTILSLILFVINSGCSSNEDLNKSLEVNDSIRKTLSELEQKIEESQKALEKSISKTDSLMKTRDSSFKKFERDTSLEYDVIIEEYDTLGDIYK